MDQKLLTLLLIVLCSTTSFLSLVSKTAVLVASVSLSGSSCVTGILHTLGLPLGDRLMGPDKRHPKGFFEDADTLTLNEYLLHELKMDHYNVKLIDWHNLECKEKLKQHIKKHIRTKFARHDIFGIKDPRLGILLPLYLEALDEMGYQSKIVLTLRHPDELVASWKPRKRSKIETLDAVCKYLTSIMCHTRKRETLIITFDEMLDQLPETVQRICEFLPELNPTNEEIKKVEQFVDTKLRHYSAQS